MAETTLKPGEPGLFGAGVTVSGGSGFDKYMKEINEKLGTSYALQVGFMEGASYPDGTSVALVAALNEFGTSRIPPRPFFRAMIEKHQSEWPGQAASILKAANMDVALAAERMGTLLKSELQQSIIAFSDPPNAPSTVARKGFNNPLIDTGHMLNSVEYAVVELTEDNAAPALPAPTGGGTPTVQPQAQPQTPAQPTLPPVPTGATPKSWLSRVGRAIANAGRAIVKRLTR